MPRPRVRLRGYLARLLGDVPLVEDVLQESYFRLLRAELPAGMTEAHRKNYLFRTATNLVRDEGRRRKSVALEECEIACRTSAGRYRAAAGRGTISGGAEAARARIAVARVCGTIQPSRYCGHHGCEAAEHPADVVASARTFG